MKKRVNENSNIVRLVGELNKEIPEISTNLLKRYDLYECDDKGFTITSGHSSEHSSDKGNAEIAFGRIPDLCRALLMVTAGDVEDAAEECSFDEFGMMLDVSRNAVIRPEALKRMIRLAALMGYDFVGLYMEDTLEIKDEPYWGYMRGRLTHDEIKAADEYAGIFGVELRPYIQTLAHVNQTVRYERYQKIIDTDDILLAGDVRTDELIDHIISSVSDVFSSRKINIGMDEAHMLGLGKYLDKHGYTDRSSIMKEHLEKVISCCKKYGLKPQMWSDMFFRLAFHGEYYVKDDAQMEDPGIPEDLELGYWDYYSTDERHYDNMLKLHKKMTDNIVFAGGAWKWTGFTPHNRYSIRIGRAAMAACRKNDIKSVVITCWGDDGAESDPFAVLPALYMDAGEAYQSKMGTGAFKILTGYSIEEFLAVDDTNPYLQDDDTIHNNAGKYLLYNDPLIGTFDSVVKDDTAKRFAESEKRLCEIKGKGRFEYLFDTQEKLCMVLKNKADLGVRLQRSYMNKDIEDLKKAGCEIDQIIKDLQNFYYSFKKQWYTSNKPFGFEVQDIRIGGLIQRMHDVRERLDEYVNGKTDVIEELEQERLPFAYFEEGDISKLNYNSWAVTATPSRV